MTWERSCFGDRFSLFHSLLLILPPTAGSIGLDSVMREIGLGLVSVMARNISVVYIHTSIVQWLPENTDTIKDFEIKTGSPL